MKHDYFHPNYRIYGHSDDKHAIGEWGEKQSEIYAIAKLSFVNVINY